MHFRVKKTFATEEKRGKNAIFYSFSVLPTSKRLNIGVIKEQQRKKLEETKKLERKNFRESRIFCNFASKNLSEF